MSDGNAWLALKNAVCGPRKTAIGLKGATIPIPIPMWECKLVVAVNVAAALEKLGRFTGNDLRHMRSDTDVNPMVMRLSDYGDLKPRSLTKTNNGAA
jgi:hypothetical protein